MNTKGLTRLIAFRAKRLGVPFRIEKNRGKGSHRMAHVGSKKCTVPWNAKDIPIGTFRSIMRALGLESDED